MSSAGVNNLSFLLSGNICSEGLKSPEILGFNGSES